MTRPGALFFGKFFLTVFSAVSPGTFTSFSHWRGIIEPQQERTTRNNETQSSSTRKERLLCITTTKWKIKPTTARKMRRLPRRAKPSRPIRPILPPPPQATAPPIPPRTDPRLPIPPISPILRISSRAAIAGGRSKPIKAIIPRASSLSQSPRKSAAAGKRRQRCWRLWRPAR